MDQIVAPIVDTFRGLFSVPEEWGLDDTLTAPVRSSPKTIYVFPIRLAPQVIPNQDEFGTGVGSMRWDDAYLNVRMVICSWAKGELRVKTQERDVSLMADGIMTSVLQTIKANRRNALWWDAYVRNIVWDALRSSDVRQTYVDVTLRINPPDVLS